MRYYPPMHRLILVSLILTSGCLAKSLRTPAQDHHVQVATIEARCNRGDYGLCMPELKADLKDMREQACLIEAITAGEDGDDCTAEEEAAK